MSNILLNADSYKASHFLQYPQKTSTVSSYIESRGGVFDATLFFGLQAFIKRTLLKPFNQADIDEADELLTAHEKLMAKFGYSVNSKGYRVLPDCVRVIQGDGICLATIEAILAEMQQRELSADNIAFGMGGELMQKSESRYAKICHESLGSLCQW